MASVDNNQKIADDLNSVFGFMRDKGFSIVQDYVLTRVASTIYSNHLNADIRDAADRDVERVLDDMLVNVVTGQDSKTSMMQVKGFYCTDCGKFMSSDTVESHDEGHNTSKAVLTFREWD